MIQIRVTILYVTDPQYAARFETHPAIIVGQLQHAGLIAYQQFNQFKVPINLFDQPTKNISGNEINAI